jgi:hypothetical protein
MSTGYATLALRQEHRDELLKLWATNMSDARIASVLDRRYRWLYEENPAGAPETRVAVPNEGGGLVGCGSVFPRRMTVGGTELTAGIPADFAVARSHRVGGAAIGIQRALVQDERYAFFIGFPNKSSEAVLRRVGYRPVASAHAWVKPLSVGYKLRPYVGSRLLAQALASPADSVMALNDWRRQRSGGAAGEDIVERADARFDGLWEQARGSYVVTGERTSAYLNWRYGSFTTAEHRFFCLTRGPRLLGYVAFRATGDKVFVADVFALDMGDTAELLMARFARAMRRERMQSIFVTYAGNPAFGERLERIGYFPRGDQGRKLVAFIKGMTPAVEQLLLQPRSWYMFDGEMDI